MPEFVATSRSYDAARKVDAAYYPTILSDPPIAL
jgi:hypothetical protein